MLVPVAGVAGLLQSSTTTLVHTLQWALLRTPLRQIEHECQLLQHPAAGELEELHRLVSIELMRTHSSI